MSVKKKALNCYIKSVYSYIPKFTLVSSSTYSNNDLSTKINLGHYSTLPLHKFFDLKIPKFPLIIRSFNDEQILDDILAKDTILLVFNNFHTSDFIKASRFLNLRFTVVGALEFFYPIIYFYILEASSLF